MTLRTRVRTAIRVLWRGGGPIPTQVLDSAHFASGS